MARILVIDDEEQVRILFERMLDREGYEVISCSNGKDGLNAYRRNLPDLVITDLVMPEKEGIETIMDLRSEFPQAKIIAISGGGRIVPQTCLDIAGHLGAQRTFPKPVERKQLLDAIRQLLV